MNKTLKVLLAVLPIAGLIGCRSGKNINQAEFELIDKARSAGLAEASGLDEKSIKSVSENIPKRGYYRMAGDFAQYSFSWEISSNRTLIVSEEGNVNTLENHKVTIQQR